MKTLNYMGETHALLTEGEERLLTEVKRQFGKDADMIMLAPHKYCHQFDQATLAAYEDLNHDHQVYTHGAEA